jgi:hypothetical protein
VEFDKIEVVDKKRIGRTGKGLCTAGMPGSPLLAIFCG